MEIRDQENGDICLNTEETNQRMPTALRIDIYCSGRSDGP